MILQTLFQLMDVFATSNRSTVNKSEFLDQTFPAADTQTHKHPHNLARSWESREVGKGRKASLSVFSMGTFVLLTGSCQNPGLNLKKERGGGGVAPVQKRRQKKVANLVGQEGKRSVVNRQE